MARALIQNTLLQPHVQAAMTAGYHTICVFRRIVTGHSGDVTADSGIVTGRSGIVTEAVLEGFKGCV